MQLTRASFITSDNVTSLHDHLLGFFGEDFTLKGLGAVSMMYGLIVALVVATTVTALWLRERRLRMIVPVADLADHSRTENSALRQLRLASHHLRTLGMTMGGHIDHLSEGGVPDLESLSLVAADLSDTADFMHDWASQNRSNQSLNDENVDLRAALDEAISTVMQAAAPSARRWQLSDGILSAQLVADRRAMRHVLTRVLSVALRHTRQHGLIRINLETGKRDFTLGIFAESNGLKRSGGSWVTGLGLALAVKLVEAQGGELKVELPETGKIQLGLSFPTWRLRCTADPLLELRSPPEQETGTPNDRRVGGYVT